MYPVFQRSSYILFNLNVWTYGVKFSFDMKCRQKDCMKEYNGESRSPKVFEMPYLLQIVIENCLWL